MDIILGICKEIQFWLNNDEKSFWINFIVLINWVYRQKGKKNSFNKMRTIFYFELNWLSIRQLTLYFSTRESRAKPYNR